MGVMEGGPAGEQDGQAVTGCLGACLAKRRGGAVTEDAFGKEGCLSLGNRGQLHTGRTLHPWFGLG